MGPKPKRKREKHYTTITTTSHEVFYKYRCGWCGGLFEVNVYPVFCLACGKEESPPPMLVSTIKLRQAGFHECMDTEDMFRKWIKRFQELRWLPPVGM